MLVSCLAVVSAQRGTNSAEISDDVYSDYFDFEPVVRDTRASGGYSGGATGGTGNSFGSFGNSEGFRDSGLSSLMSFVRGSEVPRFNDNRNSGSGSVASNQNQGGGFGSVSGVSNQNEGGGKVRRFVSVHVAPQETTSRQPRIIRAGGAQDTHVNIIFVKAPSANNEQQTEVILPEPPKQKTLVYVLIKRPTEGKG